MPVGVVDAGGGDCEDAAGCWYPCSYPCCVHLGCTILDHMLVETGLDTSQMMGHPPIVDAHRCQRCTLQLVNSLQCGLVAHICSMCPFLLIFLVLSCCLADTFLFLLMLLWMDFLSLCCCRSCLYPLPWCLPFPFWWFLFSFPSPLCHCCCKLRRCPLVLDLVMLCADLQCWGRSSVVVASLRMMPLSCSTRWRSPWLHCSLLCRMLWVGDAAAELPLSLWEGWLSWWSLGWWLCSPVHNCWPQTLMMQRLLQKDVLQKMASGVWWGNRGFLSQLGWKTFDGFASMSQSRWRWCPCWQTVAAAVAALVVETKMNWSSAASLVHSCPSAGDAAPSVRSWSVIVCCKS